MKMVKNTKIIVKIKVFRDTEMNQWYSWYYLSPVSSRISKGWRKNVKKKRKNEISDESIVFGSLNEQTLF